MITKIQRWGNSLGVRIPKSIALDAHINRGTSVNIRVEKNRLILQPAAKSPKEELRAMLRKINEANLHKEQATGAPQGNEAW